MKKIEGVRIIEGFIRVKSYGSGTESNRTPEIEYETNEDVQGKKVIIVEDIIDSGYSLSMVKKHYEEKGAESVAVTVMLDKPSRRENFDVTPEYTGFTIPDLFVVGKGLDYGEDYRNLSYIGVPRSKLARSIDQDREDIKNQVGKTVKPPKGSHTLIKSP